MTGCAEEPAEGFVWDIDLVATIDGCNNPPIGYQESLDYRLVFDSADVSLSIGEDEFATGTISGCQINYQTVVWGQEREVDGQTYEVKWQLVGEALWRQGGDTCNLPTGTDWIGTEVTTIVSSTDPNLEIGCEYTMETNGSYTGEAANLTITE